MERYHENSFGGLGSTFAGAIFMSNHMTKRECFQRKLFGLPSSQAGFVKKVKMGMILFLFEHQERKMYGVFEATSDGALNIVPNAFLKSGMAFPAQIHFKTIWLCDPLCEDEFSDAIKENYYTHKKFNFGLTYEQVIRLVHLFSLKKKTDSQEHQKFRAHNEFLKKPGKFVFKTRIPNGTRFVKSDRHERKTDDDTNSSGYTGLYAHNKDHVVGARHRLYPTVPCAPEPGHPSFIHSTSQKNRISDSQSSHLMHSTSSSSHVLRGSYPVSPSVDHGYPHAATGSQSRRSLVSRMRDPSLARELSFCVRSSMDDQVSPFKTQLNSSQQDLKPIVLPASDYSSLEVTSNQDTYEGGNTPVLKPSITSLSSIDPEGYSDLQADNDLSVLERYDPSNAQIYLPTPGIFAARGSDSLPSLNSPSNALGYSEAAGQDDGSRGYQYRRRPSSDGIPLVDDENMLENRELSRFASSTEGILDMQYSYPSKFQEEQCSKGLRACHSTRSHEYCPIAENYRLYAYSKHERTSVFTRLSQPPQVRVLHKSFGQDAIMSTDELVHLLSQRRSHWSKMAKLPRQPIFQDDDENLEGRDGNELIESASLSDLEQNSEVMVEESIQLPFRNFKRRRGVRKIDESNGHVGDGGGLIKRRKLVRPSLDEEEPASKENGECRNDGLYRDNVEDSTTSINCEGAGKTEADIFSVGTNEHSGNENTIRRAINNAHVHTIEKSAEDSTAGRSNTQSSSIIEDTTLVHVEHAGQVEKLKKLFSNLNDERVAIIDKENPADISASVGIQIMRLEGSGGKKYNGIVEKFSLDAECADVSIQNRESEERVEEKCDVPADAKLALPLNGNWEFATSSEAGTENVIIPDENTRLTLLRSDLNSAHRNLEIGGKVEHTLHAVSSDSSLLSLDVTCGDKISEKVVEGYMIKSSASASASAGDSKCLTGNNNSEEEKAQRKLCAAGDKSVLPIDVKFEGQDHVVVDIGNRSFSFREGKCEAESDDYLALEAGRR